MVAELIYSCVFWLNSFPARDGVSDTLSPRAIVTGSEIDFNKHCKLEFGAYVQAHKEHNNTIATQITGAIALCLTGNAQGGYFLYSLSTGRVLNRNNWTALPMPQDVIACVHTLARRATANIALTFAGCFGDVIPDDDDDAHDDNYVPGADDTNNNDNNNNNDDDDNNDDADYPFDENDDMPDDSAYIAGVEGYYPPNVNPHVSPQPELEPATEPIAAAADIANNKDNLPDPAEREPQHDNDNEILEPVDEPIADKIDEDVMKTHNNEIIVEDVPDVEDVVAAMNQQYGERTAAYNLRPRKPRDFGHIHATLEHTVMTQMNMKKGIKKFGDAGVDAVLSELKHLHDRKVLEPRIANKLTREEKRAALHYLMFLKKKRNGRIKGRGCADGRKQRLHTNKEYASLPTVAIEAVMLSCVIDANERLNTATVDISGAFMQVDIDELVHLRLDGKRWSNLCGLTQIHARSTLPTKTVRRCSTLS